MIKFTLGEIFQENMVLQRGKDIVLFGTAERGDRIRASLYDCHGKLVDERASTSEKDDRFQVKLAPQKASEDNKLVINNESSQQKIVIKKVHIGEVWLAGGQSNMEFFNKYDKDWDKTKKLPENKKIHFYNVPQQAFEGHVTHNGPGRDGYGKWLNDKEKGFENFSAPGYSFARKIQEVLKCPVGIIGCNWGGSTASAWVPLSVLKEEPLKRYLDEYDEEVNKYDSFTLKELSLKSWEIEDNPANYKEFEQFIYGQDRKTQLEWMEGQRDNVRPMGPYNENRPGGLYETMLSKVFPYSIAGALWYQGESDAGDRAPMYDKLLTELIQSWRKVWNDDFPFLLVQLAPFREWLACTNDGYMEVRAKQELVADNVKDVYMTSIMDIGNEFDIHPKEKVEVGKRLAGLALSHVYQKLEPAQTDNPRVDEVYVNGNQVIMTFTNTETLNKTTDENTIYILKEDERVEPEDVTISENKIILHFKENLTLIKDLKVAMGWDDYAVINIKNEQGLPVIPFLKNAQ